MCRILIVVAALLTTGTVAADSKECPIGAYRLADGGIVDIAPSEGNSLRWRRFTGESGALHPAANGQWTSVYGWTDRPDGLTVSFGDCAANSIAFGPQAGQRIPFDVTDITFESHGTKLVGRLVMPKGESKVPVVILVHGSERDSARDFNTLQRMFPAQGIGAFVYDKRGTGASGGSYTQDFDLLADDAVAAMAQARTLAGPRAGRVGYQGGSQGGWVVPLAVNRAPADFAIISFGLAVTVLEEDQESVVLDMQNHGHSVADTEKALAVARAAEAVIESGGKHGYEAFDALRQKYRAEPWYKDLHGDFTWLVLPLTLPEIRAAAAKYTVATPFRYEPMPTLRASKTPQLWVLGSDDMEAPSAETGHRITSLIDAGQDFTLAIYPGAEHGMTLYEKAPDGTRVSTRFAPGYFAMMRDFIRDGHIAGSYGNAAITLSQGR